MITTLRPSLAATAAAARVPVSASNAAAGDQVTLSGKLGKVVGSMVQNAPAVTTPLAYGTAAAVFTYPMISLDHPESFLLGMGLITCGTLLGSALGALGSHRSPSEAPTRAETIGQAVGVATAAALSLGAYHLMGVANWDFPIFQNFETACCLGMFGSLANGLHSLGGYIGKRLGAQ